MSLRIPEIVRIFSFQECLVLNISLDQKNYYADINGQSYFINTCPLGKVSQGLYAYKDEYGVIYTFKSN